MDEVQVCNLSPVSITFLASIVSHTVISTMLSFVALARPKINCEIYNSFKVVIRADQIAVARIIVEVSKYIDRRPYLTAGGMKKIHPTAVPT